MSGSLVGRARYAVGTARLSAVRSWRQRPPRLREPFFSPRRELARIEARRLRADRDPSFALDGFESHQPVLLELLELLEGARVLELGLGYGSTPIVLGRSGSSVSLETDPRWLARFARFGDARHLVLLQEDFDQTEWRSPYLDQRWDVAFVDNLPSRTRQSNLLKLSSSATFVVCHDTEECFRPAPSDYRWDFSTFDHVWTYTRFDTYTTVASNLEPIPLGHLEGVSGRPPRRA